MQKVIKHRMLASVALAAGLMVVATGCNTKDNTAVDIAPSTVGVEQAGAPPSVTDPNQDVRGYVRVLHLVPEAGPVSLMLDGKSIIDSVAYDNTSDYVGLGGDKVDINSTAKHQFTLAGADGKQLGDAIAVDLTKGEDVTLIVSGTPSQLTVTPYDHTAKPMSGTSRLALLYSPQLGPNDAIGPNIDVMLDDKMLKNAVKPGEGIAYQDVTPGAHTLKVMSGTEMDLSLALDMNDDNSYTVVVHKDAAGKAALKLLTDKFVPTLVRAPSVTTENSAP